MGTERNSNRPPSQVLISESERLVAAKAALQAAYDEARPQIMRWSVVTSALRDLVKARAKIDLTWVEIAHVATGWVEDLGAKGYSMAPEASSIRSVPPTKQTAWIERNGIRAIGMAMGIVLVWFGLLKPLGVSPVADLITKTLPWAPPSLALHVVGWWEVATGVCLLVPRFARFAVILLAVQLPALLVPFVVLPEVCFVHVPYALTLQGESLIKSLVLVTAAVVIAELSAAPKARPLP
jgi:hypothetical protein